MKTKINATAVAINDRAKISTILNSNNLRPNNKLRIKKNNIGNFLSLIVSR